MVACSSIRSVLIYGGHHIVGGGITGLYHHSFEQNLKMIQLIAGHMKKAWDVKRFYGEDFEREISIVSLKNTLIVIPPGPSTVLDEAFSLEDARRLSDAVHRGAKLLATCGSAYWLAQEMIWNPSPAHTIEKRGKVEGFPVKAVGPLFPQPGQPAGTDFEFKSVELEVDGQMVVTFSGGGGSFFYEPQDGIESVARYAPYSISKRSNPIQSEHAALLCRYGEGRALLLMTHFDVGEEEIEELSIVIESLRCMNQRAGEEKAERIDNIQQIRANLSPEKRRFEALAYLIQRLEES